MKNNDLQTQFGGAQNATWPLQGELHETHRRLFALKRELARKMMTSGECHRNSGRRQNWRQ